MALNELDIASPHISTHLHSHSNANHIRFTSLISCNYLAVEAVQPMVFKEEFYAVARAFICFVGC